MKLICGLGNPGSKYLQTRHNVGFCIIEKFSKQHRIRLGEKKYGGEFCAGAISGFRIGLLKPMTYMNLSGDSLGVAARFFKSSLEDILVIHDDADLPLGDIRFKKGGGDSGHNGIRSIIDALEGERFARLRIGIGRGEIDRPLIDHVLGSFYESEMPLVEKVVECASQALREWVIKGHQVAMNKYNRKIIST